MDIELYQEKNKYEKLIKDLNDIIIKLENYNSNLILCRKKIYNTLNINEECYGSDFIAERIDNVDQKLKLLTNVILPEAKNEYNEILYKISNL